MRAALLVALVALLIAVDGPSVANAQKVNATQMAALMRLKTKLDPTGKVFASWQPNADCKSMRGLLCNTQGDVYWMDFRRFGLTGSIANTTSEVCVFHKINWLVWSHNSLTGPADAGWNCMVTLERLNLNGNRIGGTIQPSWYKMRNLKHLVMVGNKLTGTLPPEYGDFPRMYELQYSWNDLTGILPPAYSKMNRTLGEIEMYQNRLSGVLPDSWGALTKMKSFLMQGNQFTGTLPASYGAWKIATGVTINYNKLVGTLPASWSGMEGVLEINLQGNALHGTIPSSWSAMKSLQFFHINSNWGLTGCMPWNWKGRVYGCSPSEPCTKEPTLEPGTRMSNANKWCPAPPGPAPSPPRPLWNAPPPPPHAWGLNTQELLFAYCPYDPTANGMIKKNSTFRYDAYLFQCCIVSGSCGHMEIDPCSQAILNHAKNTKGAGCGDAVLPGGWSFNGTTGKWAVGKSVWGQWGRK